MQDFLLFKGGKQLVERFEGSKCKLYIYTVNVVHINFVVCYNYRINHVYNKHYVYGNLLILHVSGVGWEGGGRRQLFYAPFPPLYKP